MVTLTQLYRFSYRYSSLNSNNSKEAPVSVLVPLVVLPVQVPVEAEETSTFPPYAITHRSRNSGNSSLRTLRSFNR